MEKQSRESKVLQQYSDSFLGLNTCDDAGNCASKPEINETFKEIKEVDFFSDHGMRPIINDRDNNIGDDDDETRQPQHSYTGLYSAGQISDQPGVNVRLISFVYISYFCNLNNYRHYS